MSSSRDEKHDSELDYSILSREKEVKSENKEIEPTTTRAGNDDSELDAILDSALADFDKPSVSNKSMTSSKADIDHHEATPSNDAVTKVEKSDGASEDGPTAEDLNYDTLADAMSKQFEECFSSLLSDPTVKKQFEDLSKAAQEAAASNDPESFGESMERALNAMSLNAEKLQEDSNQPDIVEELMKSMGASEGGLPGDMSGLPSMDGLGSMGGVFQNMIQQLLSKELLYQPLKEVAEKYKEYLDTNKGTLDSEVFDKYTEQLQIVKKVVAHLEMDSEEHTPLVKNARFENLLDLLQQMHALGNPPKEVVGDANMMMPNLPDLSNLSSIPGMSGGGAGSMPDPSQCNLM